MSYLPVDCKGHIIEGELLDSIREDTILVSIIHVNNEVGAVQDLAHLCKQIKNKKKDIIIHIDAIQSFGKMNIYPKRLGIDLLSVSSHKIHGPKGVGFLYHSDAIRLNPYIHGGGQEKGYRSGTENVLGIACLARAVELM